ncbi:hypothetical protein Bca101_097580 [Brassica carinata]
MTSHGEGIEEEKISRIEKGIEKDCHGGIERVICSSPSIVCLAQKLIAELIGTYFIIFSGCGVVVVNVLYGGKVTFPGVPLYIGAQLSGSLLASLTLRLMFNVTPEAFFGTTPADSVARALVAEIIISFLLMFVISGVATDSRAIGELAGIAVGMTIILNVFVAGPISGASMNPTRSLGPAIVMGVYKGIWIYIVGPIVGIMAGGFVYNFIRFTDKPLRELTKRICVTWGLIVMVMIYSIGHISGAHFNPAVTITFAVFRRFPWYQVPLYIGAQLSGSLLASLTLRLMFNVTPEAFFGTTPADSVARALVAEIIISFLLMFVISGVATDSRAIGELAGIAVGMTIILNVFVAGPISGASMNPARSLGPAIVMGVYKGIWIYIVGPIVGIMAGGFVYNFIRFTDKPLRELTKSASFLRSASPDPNS